MNSIASTLHGILIYTSNLTSQYQRKEVKIKNICIPPSITSFPVSHSLEVINTNEYRQTYGQAGIYIHYVLDTRNKQNDNFRARRAEDSKHIHFTCTYVLYLLLQFLAPQLASGGAGNQRHPAKPQSKSMVDL